MNGLLLREVVTLFVAADRNTRTCMGNQSGEEGAFKLSSKFVGEAVNKSGAQGSFGACTQPMRDDVTL